MAGCDEAKAELVEIIDFLSDSKRYTARRKKSPSECFCSVPPGTGKTLLARAVAGEAKVPFFSLSGSEFVEMFVVVGGPRVSRPVPAGQGPGYLPGLHRRARSHRWAARRQLLVEMDGFEPNSGVILLAATNRPDVLDRALLRPGRFDRQVVIDSPDLDGREAILKIHARDKPLDAGVDLHAFPRQHSGSRALFLRDLPD